MRLSVSMLALILLIIFVDEMRDILKNTHFNLL